MIHSKHLIAGGAVAGAAVLLGALLIFIPSPRHEADLVPGQFAMPPPAVAYVVPRAVAPVVVPPKPQPKLAPFYGVMLDTLQAAGLDHDKADAAADKLSDAVDRAVDDGISAALSTDALVRRAFFPWLAGAVGLTFIVAMIGALRWGSAMSRPDPVAPLMPHEIERLGMEIEDWAGSEARPAELVRMMLNLGWTPPPVHRGYPPSPMLRRVK